MNATDKLKEIEKFLMQPHKKNSKTASEVLHFIATDIWPKDSALPT